MASLDKPYIRFEGTDYQQETFFVKDPNHNVLEIKHMVNSRELSIRSIKLNDDQVEKILKELRDIRGVMNKAYQLFWGASILLLLILVVDFI